MVELMSIYRRNRGFLAKSGFFDPAGRVLRLQAGANKGDSRAVPPG